ncbi:hypothetical protein [Streptomyces lomondensis]|uniref:Secreted protein n=1 Tax=Streptomyces lomondensis TaxID=68229 RepID=A0ABQ2XAP3_9ACTN|nr:hypothetical protein [Streptomyces lomondensis]MCF0076966.1 hypothetical protein [Streptomyces lomondensis]GGX07650.1 hypothetical protein GCM10010383_42350 [Streptomyces lomondensis]
MRPRKTVVISLAVAALLGVAGTAAAESTTTAASAKPAATAKKDGTNKLCKRAPKAEQRIERKLKRLEGSGKGSIAQLEKRAATAKAAGRSAVAKYLDDELSFRKSLVPSLQQREKDLAKVRSWCATVEDGHSA